MPFVINDPLQVSNTLEVTGTATVNQVNVSGTATINNLTVSGDLLVDTSITATNLTGTLQTASQPNITSLGTLSSDLNMGTNMITNANRFQTDQSIINRKIVMYQQANNDHQYYGFGVNGGLVRYQTIGSHKFYNATSGNSSEILMALNNIGLSIGRDNPAYNLDVSGIGRIRNDFYVDGNVGIGTNSPQGNLHISSGTSGNCNLILESDTDNNNETDNPYIIFRQDGGFDMSAIYNNDNLLTIANSAVSNQGIVFKTGTSNGYTNASDSMIITGSGNVGIGITNPSYKLDVVGNYRVNNGDLEIRSQSNGLILQSYTNSANLQLFTPSTSNMVMKNSAGGYLALADGTGEVLYTKSGNVGIGTNSPGEKLDIDGSIRLSTNKKLYSSGYLTIESGSNNGISFNTNGANQRMLINSIGNVGIGTVPDDILHIYKSSNPSLVIEDGRSSTGHAPDEYGSILFKSADASLADGKLAKIGIYNDGSGTFPEGAFTFSTGINGGLTESMRISSNGNVSIGTSTPTTQLTIYSSSVPSGADSGPGSTNSGFTQHYGPNSHKWWLGVNSSNDFGFSWYNNSTQVWRDEAWIVDGSGADQLDFTGQHRNIAEDNDLVENTYKYIGLIVSSTGNYNNLDNSNKAKINESLPIVNLSIISNDKKVFGVISDNEDKEIEKYGPNNRVYQVGAFVSNYSKTEGENRLFINSVGEGGIWISDYNGNLENGDYITTCALPGYGMKQNDDLLHNYTVAKITQDCDFDNIDTSKLRYIDSNGTIIDENTFHSSKQIDFNSVYRAMFVGCTYHCG